jgi:transcriptional regulator with XRE-family HTH domain
MYITARFVHDKSFIRIRNKNLRIRNLLAIMDVEGGITMSNTLGNRLAICRANLNIRQIDVAAALGLTNTQLSNYEKDLREPNIATLIRLANFYSVGVEWMVTGAEVDIGELLSRDGVQCFGVELSEDLRRDVLAYIKSKTTID